KIEFETHEEAQAENFRKMLLAMARDVRVILIKLADRLHNMRTLDAFEPEKRRRIARETLDIYAPIANRLGLNSIYHELEDLSLIHLYPDRHRVLAKAVKAARGNRREVVGKVLDTIKRKLKGAGVEAQVHGREKHLYSIYRKMREKHLSFAQVEDVFAFRVVVRDVPACYVALGTLHSLYKPIPGRFEDYIAIPKANGYQSLHTTLFGPFGTPIEVQIRTEEMHKIAEAGVASHWLYKSSDTTLSELQKKTHQWLQSLLEMQSQSGDSVEFLEHLKVDLFPDEVYVFTPKGRILALPRGATAVDFAYAVHTDIGNRCVAVKINQELMPLRTELITALGSALAEIKEAHWDKFTRDAGAKSRQEILADIGLGKRLAAVVARRLLPAGEPGPSEVTAPGSVIIRGSEGMAVQFARCCQPIPGDPIIGIISKGQGMVIHTHDCPVVVKARHDPDRILDVAWDPETKKLFEVSIKTVVANQRGVLAKVAAEIAGAGSNIQNVAMDREDGGDYTDMFFTLQVSNRLHLAQIMRGLRRIPEVIRLTRVKG
ncbi:MAG: bifunctional (p)ppGpp synthetase/guanosine-3',5'-bis(diphosphate) 3'-pyrophosphohydrolase, partial [Betaproteobacteria bacterium]|nr:bifunctional (p)ppGpp synthetase/guanosine-3',5'-bis(diphosphate) 3'-pyrophosphohydrolase [Betaproteobacteria bacterium]